MSGLAFLAVVPVLSFFVRNTPESMGLHPDGDPPRQVPASRSGNAASQRGLSHHEGDFGVREALRSSAFWQLGAAIGVRQFSKQVLTVHHLQRR